MKEALQHIDLLEINLKKLLVKNQELKEENQFLRKELNELNEKSEVHLSEINVLEKKVRTLKTANAILGSKKDKRETKLKLNSLIKEIDECIVQLAD